MKSKENTGGFLLVRYGCGLLSAEIIKKKCVECVPKDLLRLFSKLNARLRLVDRRLNAGELVRLPLLSKLAGDSARVVGVKGGVEGGIGWISGTTETSSAGS